MLPLQSYCYARLPRAGLGNMLLVWARALVFSYLNNMMMVSPQWGHLTIGPILRREKSRRLYFGYFKQETGYVKREFILRTYHPVIEPDIALLPDRRPRHLYIFRNIPHWSDFFKDLKAHRDYIREALYLMLTDRHRGELLNMEPPVVGIHVRQGDFRALRPGEDFAKVGCVRTPLPYFKSTINAVREVHGSSLPVTLFSDGHDSDLAELLDMPNVYRSQTNSDVVDLLLLSKCKLIVLSPGSTFGYWSAFLSDAPVLHHPDHFASRIRSPLINDSFFEGAVGNNVEAWPELLRRNVKDIVA